MQSTGAPKSWLSSNYPAFDGLRAVAFLLVFTFHYVRSVTRWFGWQWGWVGVDLFFCLSGFLITGILYRSQNQEHRFRTFYVRRLLRIFPLYYAFWITVLVLTPLLRFEWNMPVVAMAAYLGNFLIPSALLKHNANPGMLYFTWHGHRNALLIDQLWSLCVEEQFYLVWPAVVLFVRDRKALLRLCVWMLVALPVARTIWYLWYPGAPTLVAHGALYFNTMTRADGLFAGSALWLWMRGLPRTARVPNWLPYGLITTCVLLISLVKLHEHNDTVPIYDPGVCCVGVSLVALACAAVVFLATDPSWRAARALTLGPLLALGQISYGLYFYHNLFFNEAHTILRRFSNPHARFIMPVAVLLITVCVSKLSYIVLESPFLKLKNRLAPSRQRADAPSEDEATVHAS